MARVTEISEAGNDPTLAPIFDKEREIFGDSLKPTKVLAAEKLLGEWEAKNDSHCDAQVAAHRAKLHEVQDALIVGDMARAVSLMQRLGA